MLLALVLLQVAAATPVPTPRPAPLLGTSSFGGGTAASAVARPGLRPARVLTVASTPVPEPERAKDGTYGLRPNVFPASGSATAPAVPGSGAAGQPAASAPASSAQTRMDRAVAEGMATDRNRSRAYRRNDDRAEWDSAAEACRQAPPCKPVYRVDKIPKALMTDEELLREIDKDKDRHFVGTEGEYVKHW
jgi:hypothetical protein